MAVADFEKGTKVCIRCKRELPLSCFCIKRQVRDGLNPYCRECEQERKVLRRMSNPSVARNKSEYDRKYRSQKNRVSPGVRWIVVKDWRMKNFI